MQHLLLFIVIHRSFWFRGSWRARTRGRGGRTRAEECVQLHVQAEKIPQVTVAAGTWELCECPQVAVERHAPPLHEVRIVVIDKQLELLRR